MPTVKTLDHNILSGVPANSWVAISEDQEKVVAVADTLDTVLQKAIQNGHPHPFVLKVPDKNSGLVL